MFHPTCYVKELLAAEVASGFSGIQKHRSSPSMLILLSGYCYCLQYMFFFVRITVASGMLLLHPIRFHWTRLLPVHFRFACFPDLPDLLCTHLSSHVPCFPAVPRRPLLLVWSWTLAAPSASILFRSPGTSGLMQDQVRIEHHRNPRVTGLIMTYLFHLVTDARTCDLLTGGPLGNPGWFCVVVPSSSMKTEDL